MARAVKGEAERRGTTLRKVFEEMWTQYETRPPKAKSTQKREPRGEGKQDRQILGVGLAPATARAVKTEAARRGTTLRKVFEEMWSQYEKTKPPKAKA